MIETEFKAIAVSSEINLNKIAQHFGLNRKLKWEDSLTLKENLLKGIIREPEAKVVFVFHFGSLVFVNFENHEIMDVLSYLKRIEKNINTTNPFEYIDDYKLLIDPNGDCAITNDIMIAQEISDYHSEIISTILAKSVALEKIETDIDLLLDDVEDVVTYLHQGKLSVADEQLAKMSAKILGFKFNTISYIMLLDKPDITWFNEAASEMFAELSVMFELEDRYEKIRHKSETLMDITSVFTSLAHAQRGNRLEWAIIILIAFEICLTLFEMFVRH